MWRRVETVEWNIILSVMHRKVLFIIIPRLMEKLMVYIMVRDLRVDWGAMVLVMIRM